MQPKGGVFVCLSCGAEADLRNEDGTRAVFARAARPGAGRPWFIVAGLILLLAAGAGAWGLARFGWPAGFQADQPLAATAAPPPELRTAVMSAFGPALREDLIAAFGTPEDDEVLGLAVLPDARIAVLLLSRSLVSPGDDAVHLVLVDGTAALAAKRLATRGPVRSGALATGPGGQLLALIADEAGLQLMSLDPSGARLWQQAWPLAEAEPAAAVLLADAFAAAVAAPGEAPGTLMAAMLYADGRLAWQRTFDTPAPAEAAAALDEGDLVLTWPARGADGEAGRRLVRLNLAGETLADASIAEALQVSAMLAGPGEAARVLASAPVPAVSAFAPGGARLWEAKAPGALLHDRIFLLPEAAGAASLVSAYRLSDVQTDVRTAVIGAGGDILAEGSVRLPPGAEIGAALSIGGGRILLAGQVSAGGQAGRDAFLLSLEPPGPAAAGEVASDGASDGAREGASAGPAPPAGPAPASGPDAPAAPLPGPAAPGGTAACTFACLGPGGPVTLQQQVSLAEAGAVAGLSDMHVLLCRASGAAADAASRPVCAGPGSGGPE